MTRITSHSLPRLSLFGLLLCLMAGDALARTVVGRPGIDRPIRVGMFKGIAADGSFWHSNIHTSHTVMAEILASPVTAGLGSDLIVPPAGFTFYSMPIAPNSAGTAECTGNGCGPTPEQITAFVNGLDTMDVMVVGSFTNFGHRISDPGERQIIANFWTTKGYVAIHEVANSKGTWAPLDTIHGTRFRGHPTEQDGVVRRDSVFAQEPHWQYLNRGVFSNDRDTTIFEEWFYFMDAGSVIRGRAYLKPTVALVESSIANHGSQSPMGDHPMSWYRALPTGGRFFYTALGHRSQVWQDTRMFRRQVYNAILWAAKYDSISAVSVTPGHSVPFNERARVFARGSSLYVSLLEEGPHTIKIRGLDGREVEAKRGVGRAEHVFAGLRAGVYVVDVEKASERFSRLVKVP